ncbi:MAG: hypothetical protein WBP38_05515 [Hyphomicrobium sp.]|jgi:hypothetical protein|nr:hypothetical protein [Hyphomicrobium sp.]
MKFSTSPRSHSNALVMAAALATFSAATMAPATDAHAAAAFDALKGGWSGSGTARFASGDTEKLRCTARYSGGGSSLSLNLKCASSSAQINLTGHLDANGNKVSGNWSENSYGQSGEAYGSATGNSVRLRISGTQSGFLTLNVSGRRHTVAITTKGSTLQSVNVSLGRR